MYPGIKELKKGLENFSFQRSVSLVQNSEHLKWFAQRESLVLHRGTVGGGKIDAEALVPQIEKTADSRKELLTHSYESHSGDQL